MSFQKLTSASAVIFFAIAVSAQTTTTTTSTSAEKRSGTATRSEDQGLEVGSGASRSSADRMATARGDQAGWIPSIHFGFGTRDQSGNSDLDGDAVSAMFIGTYYFPQSTWLADAGLGFQKNYFRNTEAQPTTGILSFSGRYQFPQRWSIGPVVDALVGTTDEFGSANRYMTYAGVIGFKEIIFPIDALMRVGLKYTVEVGISDQRSNFFAIVLQWGVGANNPAVRAVSMSK